MRPLTSAERDVLRAIITARTSTDDKPRAALLAQVDAAQVAGSSCDCGCASIALAVDRAAAPAATLDELSADARSGDDAVGFRLLLANGYLDDVEFYGYGEADDKTWPAATRIR